jgi:hypothetical protein
MGWAVLRPFPGAFVNGSTTPAISFQPYPGFTDGVRWSPSIRPAGQVEVITIGGAGHGPETCLHLEPTDWIANRLFSGFVVST